MPNLYIIAGCNGAGKTTASYTVLPEMLKCKEFVNADEIARGLSPFQPESVAIESGRIMLTRIKELLRSSADFSFETTLSARHFVKLIKEAQKSGYFVSLIFFWLNSTELAMQRVKSRVIAGGHNIPENVIKKRYFSGISNLFKLYIPVSNYWMVIDNSSSPFRVIAEGQKQKVTKVSDGVIWEKIKKLNYE